MKVTTGRSSSGITGTVNRRWVGVQRTRHRRYAGKENQRPWALKHGKRKGSTLPSWYHPRTPLRDITAIVLAIERKRAKLRDDQTEASQTDTDILAPLTTLDDINISTPISQQGNVEWKGKDAENCTPQKTVLDSIDEVSQIWLENQKQLEKTPEPKEAERKRKMRVLKSMR